jgi:hypothetical protein
VGRSGREGGDWRERGSDGEGNLKTSGEGGGARGGIGRRRGRRQKVEWGGGVGR